MNTAVHTASPSPAAHRAPFGALLRGLAPASSAPAVSSNPQPDTGLVPRLTAAYRALCSALGLLPHDPGHAYAQLLEAERVIAQAKSDMSLTFGREIIDALLEDGTRDAIAAGRDVVPHGFECAVTAHPEGGYTLFWASDRTLSGKYATRADARRFAELNGYRCFDHTVTSIVLPDRA